MPGVRLMLMLTGGVLVGVPEGGTVRVPVMVPVGLFDGVPVAVELPVAVVEGEAPLEMEAEALPDGDVAEVGVPEDDRVDVCRRRVGCNSIPRR